MTSITPSCSRFIRRAAGQTIRFLILTCGLFLGLVLMAIAEAAILWCTGVKFTAKSSISKVRVADISVSADGQRLASRIIFARRLNEGTIEHDVVIYELGNPRATRLHLNDLEPRKVAMSPAGDWLAIVTHDMAMYGLSVPQREKVVGRSHNFKMHFVHRLQDYQVSGLVFAPDGRLLAIAGERSIHIVRWPEGELLHRLPYGGSPAEIVFATDSRKLFSCDFLGKVMFWDSLRGEPIKVDGLDDCVVARASFSPQSQCAALIGADGALRLWNLPDAKELRRESPKSYCSSISISPDGSLVASLVVDKESSRLGVFEALTGKRIHDVPGDLSSIVGIRLASNRLLYLWDQNGLIRAWRIDEQQEQWCFDTLNWVAADSQFDSLKSE